MSLERVKHFLWKLFSIMDMSLGGMPKKIVYKSKKKRDDRRCRKAFEKRQKNYKKHNYKIHNIAILYFIPKDNIEKYNNWDDGFTAAIKLLGAKYKISWINLADVKPTVEELNLFDFLLVKSCWNAYIDLYVRGMKGLKVARGIAISCAAPPTSQECVYFYDVAWYENVLYEPNLSLYKNKVQAFGVNTDTFKPVEVPKEIDVLVIGGLAKCKRLHLLNDKKGTRVIIGDTSHKDSEDVKKLLDKDISLISYLPQEQLANYINKSHLVYIPFAPYGGGERCVLEAKYCGAKVEIADDNVELKALYDEDIIYSHYYYAEKLEEGLNLVGGH